MQKVNFISDFKVSVTEERNVKLNRIFESFTKKMGNKNQSLQYYRKHRNAADERVEENTLLSKKTEYLALLYLCKEYGFPLTKVDVEIRESKYKDWRPDLQFRDKHPNFPDVHVKSCDRASHNMIGDHSWTFQREDEIFKKDKQSSDLISLVFMEEWRDRDGLIKAIIPVRIFRKYLKYPRMSHHIGSKYCLYYEDLVANKEEIENYNYC